jgi:magnesium transporter
VRAKGRDSETIEVLYVVDRHWKLLDAIELRRFILASPSLQVSDLMDHQFIALEATQDREVAVRTMERYDLAVLPVVDTSGVLIGIITFDDVLDVAQEETTEDFHKGAAITPLKGSYREAGFVQLYRKRIGWLLALVFANIFSGAAIASFEETIAANVGHRLLR